MQITLAASRPTDATALDELRRAFLDEVGDVFGADSSVLETSPDNHFTIWAAGSIAGFVLTENITGPEPAKLRALFVAQPFRRKHVGQRALAALFEQRGGTWAVDVPHAIQPAVQFVNATLHLFSKQGVRTEHTTQTDRGRIAHLRFEVALPSRHARSNWINGGGPNPGFPFDRSHHERRRWVLAGAVLFGPAIAWFGASMQSGDLSGFLVFAGSITSTVLGIVYLEMAVTGILDRQDRGPILPPIWEDRK